MYHKFVTVSYILFSYSADLSQQISFNQYITRQKLRLTSFSNLKSCHSPKTATTSLPRSLSISLTTKISAQGRELNLLNQVLRIKTLCFLITASSSFLWYQRWWLKVIHNRSFILAICPAACISLSLSSAIKIKTWQEPPINPLCILRPTELSE